MLAGLMASTHAVPEHFDVACSPASGEVSDSDVLEIRTQQRC